jgi:NitT/TauT family transport system ATP-binding protein
LIIFRHVRKNLGGEEILGGLSFDLPPDKIYCLTGPSGCGKTTTLRMMAGLDRPDSGEVVMPPGWGVSYSFQEPRLLPWKTAEENITFVLRDEMSHRQCRDTAREYLELMGLWKYRHYYPSALSGGMQQRVSLCRAFAFPRRVVLLDEPFNSLDFPLKMSLLRAVVRIWSLSPRTVVFVTHDITEAVLMGHRVLVFSRKPAVVKQDVAIDILPEGRKLGDAGLSELLTGIIGLLDE